MKPDEAVAEKVYAAEKDVAAVRIAVIGLNSLVYLFLLDKANVVSPLAEGILGVACAYAIFVYALRPYRRFPILLSSYFTSFSDTALITLWLYATGSFDSPYYVLWYASIAAVAYRWSGRDIMASATLYGASYLALVAAEGQLAGHWAEMTVRIGYIFLLATFGALLSGEVIDQIRAKVEMRKVAAQAAAAESKFRGLLESAPDSIITADGSGRIVLVNDEAVRAFGYSRDDLVGQPVQVLMPERLRALHLAGWDRYLQAPASSKGGGTIDLYGLRKDGSEFPIDVRYSPTHTDDGLLVTAVIRDISERKQAAAALRDSEERYRRLSEVTIEGVGIHRRGEILDVNRALAAMFGYDESEMIGQRALRFFAPESHPDVIAAMTEPPQGPHEYVGLRKDGSTFPVEVEAKEYTSEGEEDLRVVALRDITERVGAEKAIRESEARFRALTENASELIIVVDRSGHIGYVSPSITRMMGYTVEQLIGTIAFDIIHPDDRPALAEVFLRRIEERGVGVPTEFRVRHADGSWRILEVIGNFDQVDNEAVGGAIFNARDITDRRQAENAVKQLAYHDSLTGLPNRALFEDRLRIALAQGRRAGRMLGVVFLDIDHFKLVNDTLGHGGGDELLQIVGRELELLLREGDTVARVGGDEFIILVTDIGSAQEAEDIAERILHKLESRHVLLGHEIHVTTSIGVSVYPEHGDDPDSLIANADIALYQAKDRGRNGYQLYSPVMKQRVVERLALENDLRNGLDRDELVLYFQPILSIASGEITGAEALVRWQHPKRGLVFPDEFIPFASESGLIVTLDEWVLRSSCTHASAWRDAGADLRIAVNLSARSFHRPDLVQMVARALSDSGLPAANLVLEVTEGVVVTYMESTIESLRSLRELGVAISIDDFGTGYSSLSYLKRFPIDSVKIDRSFVEDVTSDPNDASIVTMISQMAHSLNLTVVAEGVETAEQLGFLREQRCDEFQGYLVSRAVPVDDFARLLAAPHEQPTVTTG